MNFKKTYEQTSYFEQYKPYYYVNGKRVSEETFDYKENLCKIKGMNYNSALLVCKGKRYHASFSYD